MATKTVSIILLFMIIHPFLQFVSYSTAAYTTELTYDDERKISVITDKVFYDDHENITITVTNTGKLPIAGSPFLDIYHVTSNRYDMLFEAKKNELPPGLELGANYVFSWGQKMRDGRDVPHGTYEVKAGFQTCCGILASDKDTFYLQKPVVIEEVQNGFGLSIVVNNTDSVYSIANIAMTITVRGIILYGSKADYEISEIRPNQSVIITHNMFGYGIAEVTIAIGDITNTLRCLIIGPYIPFILSF